MKILRGLSELGAIRDFRLKDFMAGLDMDPRQPSLFYRQLVKEATEAMARLSQAEREQRQLPSLKAHNRELQSKIESFKAACQETRAKLDDRDRQIVPLRKKAQSYEDLKDFLKGKLKDQAIKSLYDFAARLYSGLYVRQRLGLSPAAEIDPREMARLTLDLKIELWQLLGLSMGEQVEATLRLASKMQLTCPQCRRTVRFSKDELDRALINLGRDA